MCSLLCLIAVGHWDCTHMFTTVSACCRALALHVSIAVPVSVWVLGILISAEKKLCHWATSSALLIILKHVLGCGARWSPIFAVDHENVLLTLNCVSASGILLPSSPCSFLASRDQHSIFNCHIRKGTCSFFPSTHVWWDAIPIHSVETC